MLVYLLPICYYSICNLALERCLRGRKSTIGNRVYVKSVPRVRIPLSPPKEKRQRKLSYFLRRERCSKLGRCKHRPSCTRLRLRHTLTAIAVRRIPLSPPSETDENTLSVFFILKHLYYFLLISLCLLSVFCSIVFVGVNGSKYCLNNLIT